MSDNDETRTVGALMPDLTAHSPGDAPLLITGDFQQLNEPNDCETVATPPGVAHLTGRATVVVPSYTIVDELGRGGMGVVYKARQQKLNRTVALKMVLRGAHLTPTDRARFLAEADAVAAIKHPHVVQVFEFGEHGGQPYFAMEFLDGGSLAGRIKDAGRLPPPDAAVMVEKIARGVQAAHDLGIVHRDLKPANVLLDTAGEPKVTDFGLAKRVGGGDLTHTGVIMGSPHYMSPEQAGGQTKFVGPPADVWALGVILYECLTAKRPFDADSVDTILSRVLLEEPTRPQRLLASIPRDLELVCLKCLEKNPVNRYQTAGELADDLRRFTENRPTSVRPAPLRERAWRWCRRNPVVAAALAAVAASLIIAGVMAWFVVINARQAEGQALELADEQRDRLWTSLVERARSERRLGNRTQALASYQQALSIKSDSGLRPEIIETITSPAVQLIDEIPYAYVRSIEFSADRRLVAVSAEHATEKTVTPTGPNSSSTTPRRVVEVREVATGQMLRQRFDCAAVGFHPDGRQLLVCDAPNWFQDGTASLWDYVTDTVRQSFPSTIWHGQGRWMFSADGKYLAVKVQDAVRVWDVTTQAEVPVPPPDRAFYRLQEPGGPLTAQEPTVAMPPGMKLVEVCTAAPRALVEAAPGKDTPGQFALWDTTVGKEIGRLPVSFGLPVLNKISPDGRFLVFRDVHDRSLLRVWDWIANRLSGQWADPGPRNIPFVGIKPMEVHDASLISAIGNRGGRGMLRVWDADNLALLVALPDAGEHGGFGIGAESNHVFVTSGPRLAGDEVGADVTSQFVIDGDPVTFRSTRVQFWGFSRPTPAYNFFSAPKSVSFDAAGKRVAIDDTLWAVHRRPTGADLRLLLVHPRGFKLAPGLGKRVWAVAPRETLPKSPATVWQFTPEEREWTLPMNEHPALTIEAQDSYRRYKEQTFTGQVSFSASRHVISSDGTLCFRTIDRQLKSSRPNDVLGNVSEPNVAVELINLDTRARLRTWSSGDTGSGSFKQFDTQFQISPDGRFGVVTPSQASCQILDLVNGGTHAGFPDVAVKEAVFSPDSQFLAVRGGKASKITVHSIHAKQVLGSWGSDLTTLGVFAVAPGGAMVASGGRDRVIRLWDTKTGQQLAHWTAHAGGLTALVFSPDGGTLYSGGEDNTLKLWDLPRIRAGLLALGLGW